MAKRSGWTVHAIKPPLCERTTIFLVFNESHIYGRLLSELSPADGVSPGTTDVLASALIPQPTR
jgi:hypothetical protein